MKNLPSNQYQEFVLAIKDKIRSAQYEALKTVNQELLKLYWEIGEMIVQKQKDLGWGKSVVERLSKDLQKSFPKVQGFSTQNLWYMRQFYLEYAHSENLQPLVGEISWSKHVVIFSKCKNELKRLFYIEMTKKYGWTKNVLIHQIENQSYEKYLLNQTNFEETLPEKYLHQAKLAIKDEYTFGYSVFVLDETL